jgi:electron transfer flavoprotein beta subunit
MKAKRKPLEVKPFAELGIEPPPRLETGLHELPPSRKGGTKVDSVAALVKALKDKGIL